MQTAYRCEGPPPQWRLGAAYGLTATDLRIDRRRVDIVQHAVSASLRRTLKSGWNLGGGVGVLAAGELVFEGRRHTYRPGGTASFSASRELLGDTVGHMFLTTSWAAAVTLVPTRSPFGDPGFYAAIDFSFGTAVGMTIGNVWSPYFAARVFGGPVWFTAVDRTAPGHDPDHHSMRLGSVFTLPRNFELGIDVAVVGARGVTAQGGVNF
jgi:hypothetical protein